MVQGRWETDRLADFGEYEDIRVIGRGGMGVVYSAHHRRLDRDVALKMIQLRGFESESERRRHLAEAGMIASLNHPNIMEIYDYGCPFYAMKRVSNKSLADHLPRFGADPRASARLMKTIALAVDHAHGRDVFHRDLKPSNILLDDDDWPYVADFGLAKRACPDDEPSLTGVPIGTPPYMSPEQAKGTKGASTAASDIYGLGAILYTMLTGRPPFRGETPLETLKLVIEQEPQSPRAWNRRVERDLEAICLKCLQKEPEQRYETAKDLADDLQRYLDNLPVVARLPTPWSRLARWTRRRPAVAGLLAVLMIVSFVALGVVSWFWRGSVKARMDLEDNAYRYRIALAFAETKANHLARAEELLELCPEPRRGWEWHFLARRADTKILEKSADFSVAHNLEYSPDGNFLVAGEYKDVVVRDAATGEILNRLKGHKMGIMALGFGPDGRLISGSFDRTATIWDVKKGERVGTIDCTRLDTLFCLAHDPGHRRLILGGKNGAVAILEGSAGGKPDVLYRHGAEVNNIASDRTGRRIASVGQDGRLLVWDFERNRVVLDISESGLVALSAVCFRPDGRAILVGRVDGVMIVRDAETGLELSRSRPHQEGISRIVYSPDGRRVVTAGIDRLVKILDATTLGELQSLPGHQNRVYWATFSPDGDKIASTGHDGLVIVRDGKSLPPPESREPRELRGHSDLVECVTFSPDNQRLASASQDGTVKFWDVATGRETRSLPRQKGGLKSVAFSPDGRSFATAGLDVEAKVWDVASLRKTRTLSGHKRAIAAVAFRPDGRVVVTAGEDGDVRFWNVGDEQVIKKLNLHHVNPDKSAGASIPASSLAFSNDGRRIALGTVGGSIYFFEADAKIKSGGIAGTSANWIHCVAFSPDGKSVASGDSQHGLNIWDADTRRKIRTLRGHADDVLSVCYSRDGRWIASGGREGTVCIWDATSGQIVRVLTDPYGPVRSVAFSPDGLHLAAAGDKKIQIWDVAKLALKPIPAKPTDTPAIVK